MTRPPLLAAVAFMLLCAAGLAAYATTHGPEWLLASLDDEPENRND